MNLGPLSIDPKQFKAQKQLIMHNPERGEHGDCLRTCVAMCLGMEPQDVPHFGDPSLFPDWLAGLNYWLAERELSVFGIPVFADNFDEITRQLSLSGGCVPAIVTGTSSRELTHAVVVHLGEVFDPHPSSLGLKGPESTGVFWVRVIAPLLTSTRTHPFVMDEGIWTEASADSNHENPDDFERTEEFK